MKIQIGSFVGDIDLCLTKNSPCLYGLILCILMYFEAHSYRKLKTEKLGINKMKFHMTIGNTLQKPLDYMKVTHLKHTAPGPGITMSP